MATEDERARSEGIQQYVSELLTKLGGTSTDRVADDRSPEWLIARLLDCDEIEKELRALAKPSPELVRDLVELDDSLVDACAANTSDIVDKYIRSAAHPTAPWVIQLLREAFSDETPPSYVIRDSDSIFSQKVTEAIEHVRVQPKRTASRRIGARGRMGPRSAGSAVLVESYSIT